MHEDDDDPDDQLPPGMPEPTADEIPVPDALTPETAKRLSDDIAASIMAQVEEAQIPHAVDYPSWVVVARAQGGDIEHLRTFFPHVSDRGLAMIKAGKISFDAWGTYHKTH